MERIQSHQRQQHEQHACRQRIFYRPRRNVHVQLPAGLAWDAAPGLDSAGGGAVAGTTLTVSWSFKNAAPCVTTRSPSRRPAVTSILLSAAPPICTLVCAT